MRHIERMGEGARMAVEDWDERLLFGPLHTLSARVRWVVVLAAAALTVGWSAWRNGDLMVAWGLPDVQFYVDMAHGRVDLVPQPFSARPLAPLLARWIAAALHCWVQGGFTVVAYVSLAWTAGVVFWLLGKSGAPRWMIVALAAVPFWPQLLGYAGLPDPLYTALLACLLVAVARGWMLAAAGLMFPLMLTRESTMLTLLCLLAVGWRRLRWQGSALAVVSAGVGGWLVHRVTVKGLPNPEHLSGGMYLAGKLVSNFARSLGILPWSNVYPELCRVPAWQAGVRLGPVREVGVCAWTSVAPQQAIGAYLTAFGVLPLLSAALLWRRQSWRVWDGRGDGLLRFSALYGSISFLIAPALGTWYARLLGYGWPLLLVAVPRLLGGGSDGGWRTERKLRQRSLQGSLLAAHLIVCGLGNLWLRSPVLACAGVVESAAIALILVSRRELAGTAVHPGEGPRTC